MSVSTITAILAVSANDITIEQLITCFELLKNNGDVGVIKFDGERTAVQYTVFITFPGTKHEMIRADESSLKEALLKVLNAYVGVRK